MDKLQGARNNEAPVLGRTSEIGASRGYKSRGTRPPPSRSVKRPIDVFQFVRTMRVARAAIWLQLYNDVEENKYRYLKQNIKVRNKNK